MSAGRMGAMLPDGRPEMSRAAARRLLLAHQVSGPALLGRRGYYRDTMGVVGANDRGVYDDAVVLVTPTAFVTFNANCDPSRERPGIAVLQAGVWRYRVGTHGLTKPPSQRYLALVQAGPVTVRRDGGGLETDWLGINIHRGGYSTTGSEGCQTIHPDQWDAFIALVQSELVRHALTSIPFVLTEREPAPAA